MQSINLEDVLGRKPKNQSSAFSGRNFFQKNPLLVALTSNMSAELTNGFLALGQELTTGDAWNLAGLANNHKPQFKPYNAYGQRIEQIDYHPSFHALMRRSIAHGLKGSIWEEGIDKDNHHFARAIRFFLTSHLDAGHLASLSVTNAAPASLRHKPALAAEWLPLIRERQFDIASKPALSKNTALIGLALSEKQAGSNLNGLVTRAEKSSDNWFLTGHKWFVLNPLCDGFITLAKTSNGLTAFFVPRLLPDGSVNGIEVLRLKETLGNHVNAHGELELQGAAAFLLGAEGHGLRTIQDMLPFMRLDGALAATGMMCSSLAQIVHHARERIINDVPLFEAPLATRTLADMALDGAALTVLSLRLAEAFDAMPSKSEDAYFAKIMIPATHYWSAKIMPRFMGEAMELFGGNAYSKDWPLERFYRQAPFLSLWGSGTNVLVLDILKTIKAHPETLDVVFQSILKSLGTKGHTIVNVLKKAANMAVSDESQARLFVEQLVLSVAASELAKIARSDIADAFLEGRLGAGFNLGYGTMDSRFNAKGIVDAMYPV